MRTTTRNQQYNKGNKTRNRQYVNSSELVSMLGEQQHQTKDIARESMSWIGISLEDIEDIHDSVISGYRGKHTCLFQL